MKPVQGMGGKAACAKQRQLRQECLQNGLFEIDITETWPSWRAVLRALPPTTQQLIIADGIAQVKFRLLQGVHASGERHVFEIRRVDTSAVHLHYHKNGSLDDPVLFDAGQWPSELRVPQNANTGASQPTAPDIQLNPSQAVIGRREAVLALNLLLNQHGFDWRRFVQNTMEHLEIAAFELEKVFALRTADSGSPKLAFCTTRTGWKILNPTQTSYKNTRLPGLQEMSSDWRTEPLFLQAQTLSRDWMRMR